MESGYKVVNGDEYYGQISETTGELIASDTDGYKFKVFKVEDGKSYKISTTGNIMRYGLYNNYAPGSTPVDGSIKNTASNSIGFIHNIAAAKYLIGQFCDNSKSANVIVVESVPLIIPSRLVFKNIEYTNVATKNYGANELLFTNEGLCVTTTSIHTGDNFNYDLETGNVKLTTLLEYLQQLTNRE
jgi:hypothetical protein